LTEEEKQRKRQTILDLIAASSRSFPKQGWDVIAEKTGFMEKAMAIADGNATNFVDAIATVGLTRFDAVEEFCTAKRAAPVPQKKGNKTSGHPVAVKPEPEPQPAALPQPGSVVLPEPVRGSVSPEIRPDADRTGDTAAVAAPVGKPGGNPGVRRPVHRGEKAEPVTLQERQPSLF
jgi:hypothetical protein